MRKSNFFLLVKQGLKGVFRYKTQFILIVILGFFASLILSISNSISDRIRYEYNKTMQKTSKFDYYDEKALETSNATGSQMMVPIMDFISDEYLVYKGESVGYNVNIAKQNEKETFITKAFESNDFKLSFNKLIDNHNYSQSWFNYKWNEWDQSPYYNAYGLDSKKNNVRETNYWYQFDKDDAKGTNRNFSPLDVYTNENNFIAKQLGEFSKSTIKILKTELIKDVEEQNGIKKQNSLFGLLFKNELLSAKDIIINDNFDYSQESEFIREVNTYMDFAFLSLVIQINKMIHDYVEYHMQEAIKENIDLPQKEKVLNTFKISSKLGIEDTSSNKEVLYSWLISKDFNNSSRNLKQEDNIYLSGAKGQLAHVDLNGNVKDKADGLKLIDNGDFIENKLKDKRGFIKKDNYNLQNADIASSYFIRQKLIGLVSDAQVYSRTEMIYSDNASEKHYRMIVMDQWIDDNVTIYDGRKPKTKNEILLNSQYAHSNKIQIGSNIKVGAANLIVSGFAADPYTNFPIADLTIPFPNNKKGAIIYINKDIIDLILPSNEAKVTTSNVYRFLTFKDKDKKSQNLNLFKSLNYNYVNFLKADNENISKVTPSYIDYNYSFKNYKNSVFSYNWELTPIALKTFSTISYIVCAIILSICLATTLIAIRKTIKFNASEIGILKALGARNSQIAFSYISYGLILLIFVVPLSWFMGTLIQELFSRLFISYTGGSYNRIYFNGWSLGVSILLFGVLTILVSYITAIVLINKPVLEIINKKESVKRIQWVDNLKLKLTKNTKFTTKFSIELAISGMKPTLVSTITILISSLLITTSMSIPGMVNKAVTSYYKNVKYSNKMENFEPIGNSPLSKTTLSAWNGVDYYESYLRNVKGNYGTVDYLSDSVTEVTGNTDYSLIPKFMYTKDSNGNLSANWSTEMLASDSLLNLVGYIFGNNLPQTLGRAINIADMQRIIEWMAHSEGDEHLSVEDRIKKIDNLTATLSEGLPPILKAIFPSEINNNEDSTWKNQITSAILSQSPSYVKSYLNKSENRYNQYTFGWTFTNYIPGDDDFYTTTNFISNDKQMSLTGVQENQKAYKLKDNSKKMYIDQDSLLKSEKIIKGIDTNKNQTIETANGFTLYSNGTLNIPVTMNEQAKFSLNKSKSNSIELDDFVSKRLVMSKDNTNIPNSAWIYDDNDWASQREENKKTYSAQNFLDPSTLDTSKFTFARSFIYDKEQGLNNNEDSYAFDRTARTKSIAENAMAFANLYYDENGVLKSEIRPYYTFDNLFLIIPKEYKDSMAALNAGAQNHKWFDDLNNTNKIPQKTIDDWNRASVGKNYSANDFMWIRPYSWTYDSTYEGQGEVGTEIANVLRYYNSFYRQNFLESKPGIVDKDIKMQWSTNINLVPVSTVDVYGSNVILTDQKLANLLHGYSTSSYMPYNYVYEKQQKSSYKLLNGEEIKTYEWNKPKDLVQRDLKEQIWGEGEQKNYEPSSWFTGIMSQSKEPYFLTSQASFSKTIRVGEYTLNGGSQYYDGLEMKSVEFLTEQKALINQIAGLILTIGISFIVVIIITATLSMIIITDLYVNQYKKFMLVMKSLGYSNWKVIKYSFGTLSILAAIAMVLGICGSAAIVLSAGFYIRKNVGSIPLGLSWWALLISSILLITSYVTSILITTWKIRKESPVSLMK
ncbi:ABC transporter permease [Spiroplasma floricola]|uniref:Efflux ABC transporter, permease protein n=1 Tax=Spiroplasma floricola 23-6 TaxID=1336749 RepID=A0A2K8SFR9_9MOLU|nr:ABC transporter permease [Spiroplasma floricola]AUB32098.1 efflux ABC transporter, permease protein [Spiroplasma floricola 23-6]